MKPPKNKEFIDLGSGSECIICELRYCSCKKRLSGEWETNLPIRIIELEKR